MKERQLERKKRKIRNNTGFSLVMNIRIIVKPNCLQAIAGEEHVLGVAEW